MTLLTAFGGRSTCILFQMQGDSVKAIVDVINFGYVGVNQIWSYSVRFFLWIKPDRLKKKTE